MSSLLLRLRGRGGSPAPPEPGLQLRVGAETLAGVGFAVTGSSISSGNGAGHWQITSGKVCVSSAGHAASLNAGPYTLTLNDGQVVGIAIDSGALDATTTAEAQAAIAAAVASYPVGKTVYLAAGGPYDLGISEFDHPLFEKYFTGGAFVIECRDLDAKATITTDLFLRGGFQTFRGLKRHLLATSPIIFQCNPSWLVNDITIDHCDFQGVPNEIYDPEAYTVSGEAGWGNDFDLIAKNDSQYANITITNTKIRYVNRGIVLAARGVNHYSGNDISAYWAHGMNLSLPADSSSPTNYIEDNHIYHSVGKTGDGGEGNGPHSDGIICSGTKTATADMTVYIRRNIYGGYGSRGDKIGFACRDYVQGGLTEGGAFRGEFTDNVVAGCEGSELVAIENIRDFIATRNTIVGTGSGTVGQFSVGHDSAFGTNEISYNVYENGTLASGATKTGNVQVAQADFGANFVGPTFTPSSKAELLAQFKNKAGGPAAVAGAGAIAA